MLLVQHGRIASSLLREKIPHISRVFISRTDGIAFYDDVALASRDSAAAGASALFGLETSVAQMLSLGTVSTTVLYGQNQALGLARLDQFHLLGVVADARVDARMLMGCMAEVATRLGASHQREVEERQRREEELRSAQVAIEGELGVAMKRESQMVGASWRDRWNVA